MDFFQRAFGGWKKAKAAMELASEFFRRTQNASKRQRLPSLSGQERVS